MKSLIRNVNNINEDNKSGSISLLNEVITATEEFYIRNKDENINLVNNILIDQLYKVYKQHLNCRTITMQQDLFFVNIKNIYKVIIK